MTRLAEAWAAFLLAVQFMTRLPVRAEWSEERMSATPRWYPAVGILVGGVVALVYVGAALVMPPVVALILSTGAGVILTGALHEDGFADCCDGLGSAGSRERALEIMRDSRVGTYGALGLGLVVAAKISALAAMPPSAVPALLIAGHAASRASALLVMATSEYVRGEGTAKPVATGTGGLSVALITTVAASAPLLLVAPLPGLAGILGLVLGHLAMRRVFERRLGGYTGDCLGAVQQISEVGLYLGFLAALSFGT